MRALIPLPMECFVNPVKTLAFHVSMQQVEIVHRASLGALRSGTKEAPPHAENGNEGFCFYGISYPSSLRIDTRATSGRPVIAVWSSESIRSNNVMPRDSIL
jgi:hypothetical protein